WTVNAPPVDGNTPPTTTSGSSTSTSTTTTQATTTTTNAQPTTTTTPHTTTTTTTSAPRTTTITMPTMPTLTNPWGACPAGQLGIIIGCRKNRRALDLETLLPQVANFPGYVPPTDRTVTNMIRVPSQVPASYLQMNGIDATVALNTYLQTAIMTCKLNLLPGFKPLAPLN
ncbi:hypothetical protein CONCODRAFT_4673, partial [Conidiobolus coronatus NRRL 28638]